ncbi:DUF3168 domain-containing protein [Xinfangfangia sp. D13-10-4-6]|uniref:tail completion protein gp17 n=1 Tax=Pseudogemmobacter hezensis TaxID=2737662 RepID=UPI001555D936|nr:DUF3168 domain-containing protein [Pseudogemmobacter hezensis]NPD15746.1 DUF3168 domain-containing protein [Pseudogemmobacter hezensis]
METALRALLASSPAVSALISDTRLQINWGVHPQGVALPALVLNVISDRDNSLHMQGTGGLWQGRVQIDCYGAVYADALALADAAIALLHGHRAAPFALILMDARRDHHDTGAADRPYRIGLDFIINYRRA